MGKGRRRINGKLPILTDIGQKILCGLFFTLALAAVLLRHAPATGNKQALLNSTPWSGLNPFIRLRDVIKRIATHPVNQLDQLLDILEHADLSQILVYYGF